MAGYLAISFLAFYTLISFYACWDGISSFGNRFFISLTPMFVLGLAVSFNEFAKWAGGGRRVLAMVSAVTSLFILWNLGFIFQWGTHLVPARGPISWKQMVHNQFVEVPKQVPADIKAYALRRGAFMHEIEQQDVQQLKQQQAAPEAP